MQIADLRISRDLLVLLVEDDPTVQRVHSMMLAKLGHRVDIAKSGLEALMLFSQNSYDIILMDVGLPDINGIQIITEIRCREKNKKSVPIIALTGYIQEEIQNECLAAGANAVATKPITIEALQTLLQRFSSTQS